MFLVIGSNMTEAHPVASTFLKNAVQNGAQLIVVDPRKHKLCDLATMHLPLKVGSDIALLNAIMHVLITEDLYDRRFVESCTTGFDALKEKVMSYPPERASEICGIDAGCHPGHRPASCVRKTGDGLLYPGDYRAYLRQEQCHVRRQPADAAGKHGHGMRRRQPFAGTEQCAGRMRHGSAAQCISRISECDRRRPRVRNLKRPGGSPDFPDKVGLMMPQMMEGLVSKKVRAFYIFGENLANSEPDIRKVEHELASAEFLVCQDIFQTETTRFAHVIFPAAAWSENDGTFTNSERRVSRVRTASPPPGLARPNWWIFKQIAKRMGHDWASDSAQEIWDNEISVLAPSLAGIKYARLENNGLQWPCTTEDHPGTCFLHQNGEFTCGRGRFNAVDWTPPAEVPDDGISVRAEYRPTALSLSYPDPDRPV